MLLKWIECQVKDENKDAFSIAQEKWSAISTVDGFIGQLGGWNNEDEDGHLLACILAIWRDQESYDSFMKKEHNEVADNNKQESTYETLSTSLLDLKFEIPGVSDFLESTIEHELLRVAICNLNDNREEHFIQMQHKVWNPYMRDANMHFGFFGKYKDEKNRLQVMTLWNNKDHEKYIESTLPKLREKADLSSDIKSIKGRQVFLDSKWAITPSKTISVGS